MKIKDNDMRRRRRKKKKRIMIEKIEINDKIEAPIGEEIDEIKMMIMITSKMWILIIMTTIIANENLQGNNAIALSKDWKRENHERKAVEMIIAITIILIIRKIIIA